MTDPDPATPDSTPATPKYLLYFKWLGRHSTAPRLVDFEIIECEPPQSPLGDHERTDVVPGEGRHINNAIAEVGLEVGADLIYENEEPEPDGTPVVFGGGRKLVSLMGLKSKWWWV
jgi:hypothetical protein